MLLLDTNALLWSLRDDQRLGTAARSTIEEGWEIGSLGVSVVTFWEIAVLAEKRKLLLGCEPARWRRERLEDGLRELPLQGAEAVRAATLGRDGFHSDPADRFIVATALVGGHTLLTADRAILDWGGDLRCVNVRI